MIRANVIALSGRAVEAAGDVDILILDKTGTITLGNRQATEFIPAEGVRIDALADAAQLASLADETPEGRSIVVLAKEKYGLRGRDIVELGATFIPFTAQTRMSGANLPGRQIRKGAAEAIENYLKELGGCIPASLQKSVELIARKGGTPLVVAEGSHVLGVIHLKDIVKGGIRERFFELRKMGIKTIMVTGDNPLTAAAIAAEAGVDDFLANATPEDKLKLIRRLQGEGHLVAMTGDGTNDAPALAQADVAVAMNTGTQAAKEAGNLVDLDSNPTKLIEVVEIGKQLLMTRGALTTFSIANDVAKYFAILPAAFAGTYPALNALNIMHLETPQSAILSAVIFNALIIIFLIPLALRGVTYRRVSAASLLRNNVFIYGLGGLVIPFIGIKIIDLILNRFGNDIMLANIIKQIRTAVILLILFSILTGLIYPLVVTGLAQLLFPWQANGSIIQQNGKVVGSALIGQAFTDPKYFWSRPSATTPFSYNAENSSGSNLGPSNPDFLSAVRERVANLHKADPQNQNLIPVDLVTASGSGLDPEISPVAAFYQAHRIAVARGLPEKDIHELIEGLIKKRTFRILGEPRVNVLELNLALTRHREAAKRLAVAIKDKK